MARQSTGTVIESQGKDGRTYRSLRFTAYGKRRFVSCGPVTRRDAERELRHVLADVERGEWKPRTAPTPPPEPASIPTFHQYVEEWWTEHEHEWSANTRADYRGRIEQHLLPYFGEYPLDQITPKLVRGYTAEKLRALHVETERREKLRAAGKRAGPKRAIGNTYINATIKTLGAVLGQAADDEIITGNPAAGKKARVPRVKPTRTYLDRAVQIEALLTAAGELDARYARDDRCRHIERRAMLSVLVLGGLRISELLALQWGNVQLRENRLQLGATVGTKTDAAERAVTLRPVLWQELSALHDRAKDTRPAALVFPTRTGGMLSKDTFRQRVIDPARERGNVALADDGYALMPYLTPHSLRRTFASALDAIGEGGAQIAREMGHTDPGFTFTNYIGAIRTDDGHREALRAIFYGPQLAVRGIRGQNVADLAERRRAA